MFNQKYAYRVECQHCKRVEYYYFDQILPDQCHNCHRPRPKIHSLQNGVGYDHKRDYKRY